MTEVTLNGKVAVPTEASRDIGPAIALRFVQAGAQAVVSSRSAGNVQTFAGETTASRWAEIPGQF